MVEAAIGDMDEWRPFCGELYPPEQTAGAPMICTIRPHDFATEKHLNEPTGFSWWDTDSSTEGKKAMATKINGDLVVDTFEIWTIKRKDTDGKESEVAFVDKDIALLDHSFYGGTLWVRQAYATVGHEATDDDIAGE